MTIPTFRGKYGEPAFMTPEDRLAHRYGGRDDWPTVPDAVVVTPQQYFFEDVVARSDAEEIDLSTDLYSLCALGETDRLVGAVGDFGIGAPTLAMVVEELRALGAEVFCIVGGCATLQPSVSPGDVIIADRSIRDEGTSYHYLEPRETVPATAALVAELERRAADEELAAHTGTTWTVDAFYRETSAEIDHYAASGVLTVEMEAAALFAVAEYRDLVAGAVFAPFDRLTGDEWEWASTDRSQDEQLQRAFSLAVTAGANVADS